MNTQSRDVHASDDSLTSAAGSIAVVFETHSISEDNEGGIATGWLDGRLSERGQQLARELGARRRSDGIEVVFTSDLRRAVETAEVAFDGSGIPIVRDPRLRECNYGDLNGCAVEELLGHRHDHIEQPYPNGQSFRDVTDGMRSFLLELAAKRRDGRILLIGHSATRWALESLIEGKDLRELVDAPFAWQPGWEFRLSVDVLRGLTAGAGALSPHNAAAVNR